MSSHTKVIIAGCGIAGPVLAVYLKNLGYAPIVYERLDGLTTSGVSLCLQPNGLHVLSKLTGLVESLEGGPVARLLYHSALPEDEGLLSETDLPTRLKKTYGFGMLGVERATFHRQLVEYAEKQGVQIVWGHQVVGVEQDDDSVTVKFHNGKTDTGSFLAGCDGLHSNTRISLFGKEEATFTGLVQVGGLSPTPTTGNFDHHALINVYGNGKHFITYPVNETQNSWAATLQEPEAKESWKHIEHDAQEKFKNNSDFSSWGAGVGELVRHAERVTKYGLYDRPELQQWHMGRVVLLGDAAHPTSPHIGQGANQAFEDIALLTSLLQKHNPDAKSPPTDILTTVFTEYERTRIPRTAALVEEARKQGELRVVSGVAACKERNDSYREIHRQEEAIMKRYAGLALS